MRRAHEICCTEMLSEVAEGEGTELRLHNPGTIEGMREPRYTVGVKDGGNWEVCPYCGTPLPFETKEIEDAS